MKSKAKDIVLDLSCLNPAALTHESARLFAVTSVKTAVTFNTNLEALLAQLQSIPKLLEFILSGEFFSISVALSYFNSTQRLQNVLRCYQRIFYRSTPLPLKASHLPSQTHSYNNSTPRCSQYRGRYQWRYPNNLMDIANPSCLPPAY